MNKVYKVNPESYEDAVSVIYAGQLIFPPLPNKIIIAVTGLYYGENDYGLVFVDGRGMDIAVYGDHL